MQVEKNFTKAPIRSKDVQREGKGQVKDICYYACACIIKGVMDNLKHAMQHAILTNGSANFSKEFIVTDDVHSNYWQENH